LVEQKCEIVIAVGFMMGDAIKEAAGKYPDTKFAIVDFAYDPAIANVRGLVFRRRPSWLHCRCFGCLDDQKRHGCRGWWYGNPTSPRSMSRATKPVPSQSKPM
jgi:hypothetical protein